MCVTAGNRDYNGSLLAESVTFESGDETQSLILSFIDDSFLEFDENIRLLLSLDPDEIGVMLLFGLESANITLLDDDCKSHKITSLMINIEH